MCVCVPCDGIMQNGMVKIKAFWIAILDFVLFWDLFDIQVLQLHDTHSTSFLFSLTNVCVCVCFFGNYSFCFKVLNRTRNFQCKPRTGIKYQTTNSPTKYVENIFSLIANDVCVYVCVCGLNCYFQLERKNVCFLCDVFNHSHLLGCRADKRKTREPSVLSAIPTENANN